MSLPALRALRERFPQAEIAILAKPWVADLYRREPFCDQLIPYTAQDLPAKMRAARDLRPLGFDCAILLQNAFEAALVAFVARIPERIGYARDGRSLLLTRAIEVPAAGEIPLHERFYIWRCCGARGLSTRRRTIASNWMVRRRPAPPESSGLQQ